MKIYPMALVLAVLMLGFACSKHDSVFYKNDVQKALEQADFKDLTVSEDTDKNTVTIGGTLHSAEAKSKAGDVAKSAAGPRIIANEISVQPVGFESDARNIASDLDDAIEKNYKASLISHRLNRQHIGFNAKNGVLTLTGSVNSAPVRHQAETLAAAIPNVQQVVNQLDVKR